VLKAGGVGESGKLYLLDMGDPVRIQDLAEQMIRFYGFEPGRDIKIEYIGLRPGERIDEQLWGSNEIPVETEHPRIRRVERRAAAGIDLPGLLAALQPVCRYDPVQAELYRDRNRLRTVLRGVVPTLMIPEHESAY
jgi:FlaA1/EpsC-like NDP-sugar epimerase